ncbi:auxin-responsive protein IAA25-like [Dioscorea cayenensis subsp. rotundata]|uniref:Auxin-responsive protein n=1 Tax=Dioscorea cayennensis subsp. rotundata TaxID=55577 RepID=A0AB40B4Z8_DIOCR|nr:auxin-responsive protein IAA25-like [Dioscorea cayenensis subsp. rotundata]
MFAVKVNICEGYAVGRKIDLKAHDSYDSLSKSLQKMFQNFLSVNIQGIITKENERVDAVKNNYILLYEDNEGDRMLVGDVPWEMFITSVKRLHIALDPRAMNDGEGMAEEQERN